MLFVGVHFHLSQEVTLSPTPAPTGAGVKPTVHFHFFFFSSIDGTSYYIELKLPQIWSSKLSCLPATSHWLPPHFLSWEN